MSDVFREKVVKWYKHIALEDPKWTAKEMAELAPGVVGVKERCGYSVAVFDAERWERNYTYCQRGDMMIELGLDTIDGCTTPACYTIQELWEVVPRYISRKRSGLLWHCEPLYFTFPL